MKDILTKSIHKSIEEIKRDNISGSVELAKKSAEILIELVNKDITLTQIKKASYSLVKVQPNMASIFNLVNNLMLTIDKNKKQQLKNIVYNYCKKYIQDLESSDKKISKLAIKLIKNNSTIITHSYSSTVLNTLIFAKNSGKKFSVISTEARPIKEGVKFAKKLGENNIKVKLLVDSAVFSFISYADMILIGGDAVTDSGLINKIGTKGIAMTAQHYNTPTYALCSTIKFLPKNYPVTLDNLQNPNEIIQTKISNVTPINYYFDYTPLEFLTGIITEKEILKPKDVKKIIKNLRTHNIFL